MSTETAPDVDVATLVDAFARDDPDLTPAEKETTLRFARDEGVASFYTEEAGIGRRLIAHPESVLDGVVIRDGSARPTKAPATVEPGDEVVGVRGTIPVGALAVKSSSRKSGEHAQVVSGRVLEEVQQ
jgi:hypothetical protein